MDTVRIEKGSVRMRRLMNQKTNYRKFADEILYLFFGVQVCLCAVGQLTADFTMSLNNDAPCCENSFSQRRRSEREGYHMCCCIA